MEEYYKLKAQYYESIFDTTQGYLVNLENVVIKIKEKNK